jgi:uncharacterized Zn finger protein
MINKTIPRLNKAYELIANGDVVLTDFGRALVYGSEPEPYKVNYTLEKCECYDNVESGNKCKHIWAAQLLRQAIVDGVYQ